MVDSFSYSIKCGSIDDSSCFGYFEIGSTKVYATVHHPREHTNVSSTFVKEGVLDVSCSYSPFASKERNDSNSTIATPVEIELARVVYQSLRPSVLLSKYRKSLIPIHVAIIESGEDDFVAAIMASSLALARCGIEMYDFTVASYAVTESGIPDKKNIIVFLPVNKSISYCSVSGHFNSINFIQQCLTETLRDSSLRESMKRCLLESYSSL